MVGEVKLRSPICSTFEALVVQCLKQHCTTGDYPKEFTRRVKDKETV